MEMLWQDIRYAIRMLWKNPGFTAVAVLTFALGIGANTAVFSLVNGILLRPLPYLHPNELVSVTGTYPKGAYAAMRQQVHTMDVATYAEGYEFNLSGLDEPVRLSATLVSANLFSVLDAKARIGRSFENGDDLPGQNSFVILSNSLWQRRFNSDPSVIGRWIKLEGVQRQVVGIMPADFRFPSPKTEVWIPLDMDPRNTISYWAHDFMPVIGRLRPNVTMQQAGAEIRLFQSHVGSLFPWSMPADWNADISVVSLREGVVGDMRERLLILLAAVGLVLLVACANVANLTLSRAAVRGKEMALRISLGAARNRIVRQLVTESVVMGAAGGALGLLLASSGLSLFKATLPANTPRLSDTNLDFRVLLFAAGLALLAGILSGIAPALQSSRTQLTDALKEGSRGTTYSANQTIRRILVIAELGLAVLLVSGAGLLIHSLWALAHVDPGFRSENVLTARITPNTSLCDQPDRCSSFYRALVEGVRSLPGVSETALVNTLPLDGRVQKRILIIEDRTANAGEPQPLLWMNAISPGYFRAMRIPLLRGRDFTEEETSGSAHVAILTASTARRFWPNEEAVGKHVRLDRQKEWSTVVGVAADVQGYSLRQRVPEYMQGAFYVPYGPAATLETGEMPAEMTLVVRSSNDPAQLDKSIRELASSLNRDTPVAQIEPMTAVLSNAVSGPRSITTLFGAFAGLALVLGVVGIYGVIAFFVGQRTREFGVRMALGAQRRDVLKLVLREGLSLVLVGVALGLASAFALTRFLGSQLYGVSATDPRDFAAVAILFAFVALAACYIPARRATRVDPMVALRYE